MSKDDLLKPVTLIVIGYIFIYLTQTYLSLANWISNAPTYIAVISVMTFIAGAALVAAFVLLVIATLAKLDALKNIITFILFGVLVYAATMFVMWFTATIIYIDNLGWTYFFTITLDYLALPCAAVFAVLPALVKD